MEGMQGIPHKCREGKGYEEDILRQSIEVGSHVGLKEQSKTVLKVLLDLNFVILRQCT